MIRYKSQVNLLGASEGQNVVNTCDYRVGHMTHIVTRSAGVGQRVCRNCNVRCCVTRAWHGDTRTAARPSEVLHDTLLIVFSDAPVVCLCFV